MSNKSRITSSATSEVEAFGGLKFVFRPEYDFLKAVVENKTSAENIVRKALNKMVEIGEVRNLKLSFNNCNIPDEELNKILRLLSKSRIKKITIVLGKWEKDCGSSLVAFEFGLESLKLDELKSWLRNVGSMDFHANEKVISCLINLSHVCIALDSVAYDDAKQLLIKIVNRIPTPIPSLEEFVIYAKECGLKDDDFILFLKPISDFKLGGFSPNKNESQSLRAFGNVISHFKLRELRIEIQENKVRDLNPLGEALLNLTELRSLYLDASYNSIHHIEKLAEGLKALKNLEYLYLNLYKTWVDGEQVLMLVRALKSLNNLREVHLDFGKTLSYDLFNEIYDVVIDLEKRIPKFYATLAFLGEGDEEPRDFDTSSSSMF